LLAQIYQVWRRGDKGDSKIWSKVLEISKIIGTCDQVEDYIWPQLGEDWLERLDLKDSDPEIYESLLEFRIYVRRWQGTVLLPVNQVILTLAQDIFVDSAEIALTHKLAALLRQAENTNPDWRMSQLAGELKVIASNERRFIGFSSDDAGFDPDKYKGVVVISTMHKAKGLEWDRVYLMSVNNYSFPSGELYDQYIPEKWFIRDNLNLEAETLSQLEWAVKSEVHDFYEEGAASGEARLEYIRERLRLFYVGITRARKKLVVTWNTGRWGKMQQSIPFASLYHDWKRFLEDTETEGEE
jgi:DNA helicase-2/ATP-dependent DNA helicase PcrA